MRDATEHAPALLTGLRQERSRARSLLTASWQERGHRYGAGTGDPSSARAASTASSVPASASTSPARSTSLRRRARDGRRRRAWIASTVAPVSPRRSSSASVRADGRARARRARTARGSPRPGSSSLAPACERAGSRAGAARRDCAASSLDDHLRAGAHVALRGRVALRQNATPSADEQRARARPAPQKPPTKGCVSARSGSADQQQRSRAAA